MIEQIHWHLDQILKENPKCYNATSIKNILLKGKDV